MFHVEASSWPSPAASVPASSARSRSSSGRSRSSGRRSTSATKSSIICHVVEDLRTRGAIFVDELDEIPPGSITIFSRPRRRQAESQETCGVRARLAGDRRDLPAWSPRSITRAAAMPASDREIVLVGSRGARRGRVGTIGQIEGTVHLVQTVADAMSRRDRSRNPAKLAYITQTTLSVDDTRGIIAALKARFPQHRTGPDVRDICYATQNRQQAVHDLAQGGRHDPRGGFEAIAATPTGLREIGEELGQTRLPDRRCRRRSAPNGWRWHSHSIGVTAGASAPEMLVQGVIWRGCAASPRSTSRTLHWRRRECALPLPRRTRRRLEDRRRMAVPLNQMRSASEPTSSSQHLKPAASATRWS